MPIDQSAADYEPLLERFEEAWRGPEPPRLEDYLPLPESPGRMKLLCELACIDLERRMRRGQDVRAADYLARFPELAEDLGRARALAAWEETLCQRGAGQSLPPEPTTPDVLVATLSSRPSADRNLLFGILALQMDFVSRDALITAMNAWVLAKRRPLGEILVEQRALTAAHRDLLEPLVEAHVRGHGNDPAQSLAALGSSAVPALNALQQLQDGDVQASLRQIPGTLNTDGDPYRTVAEPRGARPRFRILRRHAKGGLGEVFVAQDEELNRPVALKEIQVRHAGNRDSRGRFLLEAEITGRLEHPGIVPVYGLGTYADGRPFYAMRFIEGHDLREAIERFHATDKPGRDLGERRLAFRELLGRFVDVCQAVAFAHSRGVLHRDLKPGNVMLGKYGETLVVDWGLAKAVGRREEATLSEAEFIRPRSGSEVAPTQYGEALGTPAYMSPEQAVGQIDKLGAASDIYSLGATLYTLLTGKPPVEGADVGEVLRKVQRGEVVPPRQIKSRTDAALDAICGKAMALRPEGRYATALALAADVEHWLADERVVAYREPLIARARRWLRHHRTLVAAAMVALILLTGGSLTATVLILREKGNTQAALEAEGRRRTQARNALDAMTSTMIDTLLSKQQQLTPELSGFLRQALDNYDEFARETGEDAGSRSGVAKAHLRVAQISARLGRHDAAGAAYLRAIEVQEKLARDEPSVPDFRRNLAGMQFDYGEWQESTGHLNDAESSLRQSVDIMEGLARDQPENPTYSDTLARALQRMASHFENTNQLENGRLAIRRAIGLYEALVRGFPARADYRADLASCYHCEGNLLDYGNDPSAAEDAYKKSISVQRGLLQESPTDRFYRHSVAMDLRDVGIVQCHLHHWKEGEDSYREALRIELELCSEFPAQVEYRWHLGAIYNSLANLFKDTNRLEEAESLHMQALAARKRLASDYPQVLKYALDVALSHGNLAEVLTKKQTRLAEAEEHYQLGVDGLRDLLRKEPRHAIARRILAAMRIDYATAKALHGSHAAAVAEAESLAVELNDPGQLYNLACVEALSSRLVLRDFGLPPFVPETLSVDYGARAVVILRRAAAAGYKDVAQMKKDTDLDALRDREDFKKLVADLEAKLTTEKK
jgi:eukaryotic-like serine/threonine-protein kinase